MLRGHYQLPCRCKPDSKLEFSCDPSSKHMLAQNPFFPRLTSSHASDLRPHGALTTFADAIVKASRMWWRDSEMRMPEQQAALGKLKGRTNGILTFDDISVHPSVHHIIHGLHTSSCQGDMQCMRDTVPAESCRCHQRGPATPAHSFTEFFPCPLPFGGGEGEFLAAGRFCFDDFPGVAKGSDETTTRRKQ